MLILVLTLLAFSTWQATETICESELFEPLRRLGERLNDHPSLLVRMVTLPIRASTCSFCMSHWVAMGLTPVALISVYCVSLHLIAFGLLTWLFTIACCSLLRELVSHFRKNLIDYPTEELEAALLERLGPGYEVRKEDG